MLKPSPFTPHRNRSRGTTLLEVLVVIVIFLVGILAAAQIFPKGFQILVTVRNNGMATALARQSIERIQSRPDEIPEEIVSAQLVNGVYVADPNRDPNDLGPQGAAIDISGTLYDSGSNPLGNWQFFTGPNAFRRIIGESQAIPAPRNVGTTNGYYGGLMVLNYGPIDFRPLSGGSSNVSVYGNDLLPLLRNLEPGERWNDGEFFVTSPDTNAISFSLPSGPTDRFYRVTLSAYVQANSTYVKRDYIELGPVKVAATAADPVTGLYPLMSVSAASLIPDTLGTVDTNTIRIQRAFVQIANGVAFDREPYEYKLLDSNVGVLLFNPVAYSLYTSSTDGRRLPFRARVNYDVYDWRILHDDFRLPLDNSQTQQYKLSVPSLKVSQNQGPDGRTNGDIVSSEDPRGGGFKDTSAANDYKADNFVLVDLDTGGIVMERAPGDPLNSPNPLVAVNKSTGVVTFYDADGDPSNGTTGYILLPDGTTSVVQLENRALRALYRGKNEFSVQVLKAADRYSVAASPAALGIGQCYIGGSVSGDGASPTRIYFPPCDNGRKVSLGEISYISGGVRRQVIGQDFVIKSRPGNIALPSIDLAEDVDSNATGFDFSNGSGVKDIHGASIAVRVLWNPAVTYLAGVQADNMNRIDQWGRNWRRSTNETYIVRQEDAR